MNKLWKEGRVAAVSLVYQEPRLDQWAWIEAHHAAVGIRATLVPPPGMDTSVPVSRNWDVRENGGRDLPPQKPAPRDPAELMRTVEDTVPHHGWTVWRFTPDVLDDMGQEAHGRLLRELGDHHARLWCAPVRDIAAFAG